MQRLTNMSGSKTWILRLQDAANVGWMPTLDQKSAQPPHPPPRLPPPPPQRPSDPATALQTHQIAATVCAETVYSHGLAVALLDGAATRARTK